MARIGILLFWLLAAAASAEEKYPFTLDVQKDRDGATFWGRNDGPAPVSVVIRLPVQENLRSDEPLPATAVVPAHSSRKIVRVSRLDARGSWRYESSWSWRAGDVNARPDPQARYRVPWMDGRAFTIGQAPGGRITTHTEPWSREAIDVNMPEGTPVLAARAGVVIRAVDEYSEGRLDPALLDKANLVRVLHDDGTMGEYLHFKHAGVAVKEGERVAAGRILGYSGSTGFSAGPHLHFAIIRVARSGDGLGYVSEPFSFYVGTPAYVFFPKTGMVVPAEYASPGAQPKMGP